MEEYKEIKKYMNLFDKEDDFHTFNSSDLFFNIFNDKKRYLFSFINSFLEDSVGIQLFFNNNGFNYVNDILSISNDNMLIAGKIDSICAVYLDKDLLTDDDKEYIHKMGFRLKKEKNLIIYRYEVGHMKRYANKKEMQEIIRNCEFVYSLLKEKTVDLITAFDNDRSPISYVNDKKYAYETIFYPLPNLCVNPRKLPVNVQVAEEFKSLQFTGEECYIFVAYTPLIIKETGVRPLLVYFYFSERNKVVFKYITDKPKEYKNYIFGLLDEVFNNEGVPDKIYLNDRNIYAYLYKTLKSINVNVEYLLENSEIDLNLLDAVERLYQNSEELYTESKDGIEMVLELIVNELNALAQIIEEESEAENKKENIVV